MLTVLVMADIISRDYTRKEIGQRLKRKMRPFSAYNFLGSSITTEDSGKVDSLNSSVGASWLFLVYIIFLYILLYFYILLYILLLLSYTGGRLVGRLLRYLLLPIA